MTTCITRQAHTVRPRTIYGSQERIVLIDLGLRETLVSWFAHRGCRITIIGLVSCRSVLMLDPSVVVIAGNGAYSYLTPDAADLSLQLSQSVPLFGVGIGMEAVITAFGGTLDPLPQPHDGDYRVVDLDSNHKFMTDQDHHVAVYEHGLLNTDLAPHHRNEVDQSIEAVRHTSLPVAAVHYHPESGDTSAQAELIRLLNSAERRSSSVSPVCYPTLPT